MRMGRLRRTACFSILLALAGCGVTSAPPLAAPVADAGAPLRRVAPADAGFSDDLPARIDSLLARAVEEGVAPGFAVAVGRYDALVHVAGHGRIDTDPASAPIDPRRTLFDLASLTKVVATTTAAMMLEEQGLLDLDRPVREYLPEFDDPTKSSITPRMLLLHTGGLEAFAALYLDHRGRDAYLREINARPLRAQPGTTTVYSDWDFVLLQLIIERVTGEPLDRFLTARLFAPLGMDRTMFNPPTDLKDETAATEIQEFRGGKVQGEVHDENAWALGGVAGHAGLFSTASDLAVFARMMLAGGGYGDARLLDPRTIARWTAPADPTSSRALGWDTPSPRSSAGRFFSPRSFGHTGFTGTSMWMDPQRGVFVILLSNRVNPTRENSGIGAIRRALADLVQESINDAPLVTWEPSE